MELVNLIETKRNLIVRELKVCEMKEVQGGGAAGSIAMTLAGGWAGAVAGFAIGGPIGGLIGYGLSTLVGVGYTLATS
ncbi:hypothetical protein [Thalassotalea sp. 1_MG-2023]|uniref:hypothetical protein n=1 Tax=Thalassotalea sp. 1_MG-2023 TaxID=3062680 RepID=UPI0026E1FFC1|nr:hypothetical protein [Thalassotalea sp. 1_MG-2023]